MLWVMLGTLRGACQLLPVILLISAALSAATADEAFRRALGSARTGQFAAARDAIRECLKLRPDFPEGKALAADIESELGFQLAGEGRFAPAAVHFREVTRLKPSFAGGHYN